MGKAASAAKRVGRPTKPVKPGRTTQIGVIVTGETKALITQAAKNTGRTISRQVEHMVERCVAYEQMFEAMRRDLKNIESGNITAAMDRQGYKPVRHLGPDGKAYTIYVPKDLPGFQSSHWVTEEEDQ